MFLILIATLTIIVNPVFAQCAYDPSQPHKPCDDTHGTLIIETNQSQIEQIDGQLFYVIGPFAIEPESSNTIRLDTVLFTPPFYPIPTVPGGVVSVKIIFSDGAKETIGRVGPPNPFVEFTKHQNPQAGVKRNADGTFNFLLSIENQFISPLRQFQSGINIEDIICQNEKFLILKYDDSPACVTPETKQHLIDRGWAKTKTLDEIQGNPNLIKQNIVRIEDGFIALYPENMCASIDLVLPTEQDIQRYKNDEKGLDDTNILQITFRDLQEIPNIQELIYAVHSIEFPYNKHSSAYLDSPTFVEYEFFLMEKAMKKYGDSQEDYFIKLDEDYEERFINPAKQGFTNTFEAPMIVYNDNVYSVDGTVFWTSDEHEPIRMGVYPKDTIGEDKKFITLTDEDMRSIPKIKEAIQNIGTVKESITAHKGLPEDQWNEYWEWFKQTSQDRLNADRFRLIQYDKQFYSVGFGIC